MGCVCCSLSSFVSILLDALERVSLCTVCAMLTCCLLLTILIVMVMGIGIGYHYCFVQNTVDAMEKAAKAEIKSGSEIGSVDKGQVMRSVNKAMMRGFSHRISRRDASDIQTSNNYAENFTLYNNTNNFNDTNEYIAFNKVNFTSASD